MEEIDYSVRLRIDLVRQVAAPTAEANLLASEIKSLQQNIVSLDDEAKKFRESTASKCVTMLQTGFLALSVSEIENDFSVFLETNDSRRSRIKKEIAEKGLKETELRHTASEASKAIYSDIITGKYGFGEIIHYNGKLSRVFGRIEEKDERLHFDFILPERAQGGGFVFKSSRVLQKCENQEQSPPLIQINLQTMPLTAEEAYAFCRCHDDYALLIENIPAEMILWDLEIVYCIERNSVCEIFLVPISGDKTILVRVRHGLYPHCTLEVLGKFNRSVEALERLSCWGGCSDIPIELEEAKGDEGLAINIVIRHMSGKHPGINISSIEL